MLYPLVWLLVSSFKPTELIFRDVSLIPTEVDWTNYSEGWNALQYPFGRYLMNSAIIVLGSLLGNLVSCSMAAYAFARLEFRGRKLWFAIMLMSIMLPIHVIIVPQYILFARLDWINTFLPLIVPKLLATDAFFIFLMVQFFRGIPRELDEAARLDGCGHGRIYLRIMLPLSLPALATTAIFTFIWTWNDFFSQLIFLDQTGHVHRSGCSAHLPGLHGRQLVGPDVRDVDRLPHPRLPRLPLRPEVPGQGDRDDGHQVAVLRSAGLGQHTVVLVNQGEPCAAPVRPSAQAPCWPSRPWP